MRYIAGHRLERLFWNAAGVDWSDVSFVDEWKTEDGIRWERKVYYRTPNAWGDGRADTVVIYPSDETPGCFNVIVHDTWNVVPLDWFDEPTDD